MVTYLQWDRTRPLRQVAWVCGPEPVLCGEVVRHYRQSMPDASTVFWPMAAGVWDSLLASQPGARLSIVSGADFMSQVQEYMPVLLETLNELSRVVFVSAADDFAREKDQLVPHLAAIRDSKAGQLIRCCRPSKEEDLLKLIASWWPGAGLNIAARLWARCGDNLTAAWQACDKAARASLTATEANVGHVAPSSSAEDWARAVLAGNRKQAMEAAAGMPASLRLRALASLNTILGQAASLTSWKVRGLEPDEIARRGLSRHWQRQLSPFAGRYGPEREIACRRLLARAEDSLRSGAGAGVLEALTALW